MNQFPYGAPPPGAHAPPGAFVPPDARALLETPAIRGYLKNHIYERVGSVAEIEADLATIRALSARSKARWPIFLLALLASLAAGFPLVAMLRHPLALGAGVIGAIVIGVYWSKEPTHQAKRVELASGVIRRLVLEPGSQLSLKLDLEDIEVGRKKKIDRNEAGWSVTYHHDDWLLLEGRIVGEVAFRYTRGESRKKAVHVSRRGNTTITRTRTEGWFHDGVALRFASDGFPGAATLGPEAYKKLKLPEGFETKHFLGQPGMLELTITSDRKWDAGPPGQSLDGADGVKFTGIWFSILFDLLGALRKPFEMDTQPPPSPTSKLPTMDGDAVVATLTHPAFAIAGLALPAALLIASGVNSFNRASSEGDDAVRYQREAKTARDASTRSSRQIRARFARNREDDALMVGWIATSSGTALAFAAIGLGAFGVARRKKKDAAASAALPLGLPMGAAPPPQGAYPQPQGAYPGAPPPQGAYPGQPPPQGAYPGQPPSQGAYPGAPPPQGAYPGQPPSQGAYPGQPPSQGAYPGQPPQGAYPGTPGDGPKNPRGF